MAEKAAAKQRRGPGRPFRRGESGNPAGKAKGTRHWVTMLAERLLDGEAEALLRKMIELALAGDTVALRICIDRIVAPRRDRPVRFKLPELGSAADACKAMAAVAAAVALGDLTPAEAGEFARLVETHLKAIELTEIERRLQILEGQPAR